MRLLLLLLLFIWLVLRLLLGWGMGRPGVLLLDGFKGIVAALIRLLRLVLMVLRLLRSGRPGIVFSGYGGGGVERLHGLLEWTVLGFIIIIEAPVCHGHFCERM